MAENFSKARLYEYGANSNLVLEAERDSRRRSDEPKGEVESLRGIVSSIKMGDRLKTKTADPSGDKAAKRRRIDENLMRAPSDKRGGPSIALKGSTVLSVADEIDNEGYYPKSAETKAAFEELMVEVQRLLGDQPQDVLRGATFELLEILKDDKVADYKKLDDASKLISMSKDVFSKLLLTSKRITDFSLGGAAPTTTEIETMNEDMAVVFEDEEGGEAGSGSDNEEDEGEADADALDDEEAHANIGLHAFGVSKRSVKAGADGSSGIDVHEIDAYWLQRQISKIISDANVAARIAEEALNILHNSDERVCENKLVALLEFDNFDLIKLLVNNRLGIYYATKIKQAQNEIERQALEAELKETPSGQALLEQLHSKTSAQDWSRSKAGGAESTRRSSGGQLAENERMQTDEDNTTTNHTFLTRLLHLDDLAFHGSNHFMANDRVELPEKSWRAQKKGYEEVHVPALKPPVVSNEQLRSVASLPTWMQSCFDGVKHLNRVQSKMCDYALEGTGNMLLCAPTGSGKTNVALLTMLGVIANYRNEDGGIKANEFKIVYVAPMKALVQECVQNFSKRLAPLGLTCKELSGDQSLTQAEITSTQVIVTTPEKWDVITRKAGDRAYLQLVRLMIVDEIHLLHDERGPVLESIIARTIRTCEETKEHIRMVGLSATLPNYQDVAAFMRVDPDQGLFFFDNSYRPVPLQQQFIGVTEKKALKKMMIMNEICYEKIMLHAGKNQLLIFTHSRADTVKTARALVEMCMNNGTLNKFIKEGSASSEILRDEAPNAKNTDLQDLMRYGFAFHHAGLARADRTLVEDLFGDKHLQVLVSTATLAWGVNLPCRTVIIKGTQVYSPEQGKWTELSALDVMQMMGRAGRYGLDSEGEGIILTQHSELQYYLSLMNQQLPIESHMIKKLPEALNAEIVLGSVASIKDAVAWLGYTYLYVRMLRNPQLYSVFPDESDPLLNQRRLELVYAAINQLEKRGMLQINRQSGAIQSNYIGRIASYYYITHDTMDIYVNNLRPTMNEIELFRLVSMSSEFKNIYIRGEEKLELAKLIQRVPIPVKESVEEPSAKINVLLQSYIARLKLEGFALSADMIFIQQSAARLLRSLFELAWKKRWAAVAVRLLELAIMVDRKLWKSQSPLRQFNSIPELLIRKLERISDITWEKYHDLQPADFGEMVKIPKMGKTLHKFVHMIPRLHIDLRAYPISRSLLKLDIELTPDFEINEAIHGKSLLFWIMIEDGDGETLLHTEAISFAPGKASSCKTSCTVDLLDPLPPQYFLRVISDRWLHSNTVIPISFKQLILPEKFALPTQVLDLKPVVLELLPDERMKQFFAERREGVQQLNTLQTQCYHALTQTDANVLICAPSGSGKQVCAELAILRFFMSNTSSEKVLYICPHQTCCLTTMLIWSDMFSQLYNKTVVLLSGETNMDYELVKQGDVIISTPESWDLLSKKWKQRKAVQQIGLYIFDHIHILASHHVQQAACYEMVVSRTRFIAIQKDSSDGALPPRFIGLGYAIANAKDVASWLGVNSNQTFAFAPQQAPGTVQMTFYGSDHHDQSLRISSVAKHMFSLITAPYTQSVTYMSGKVVKSAVFAPNRKLTRLTAIDLISFANNRNLRFVANPLDQADHRLNKIKDTALKEVLLSGIGYWYEGQEQSEQSFIEELFLNGQLAILIIPFPLAFQFQATAERVYLMDTQLFDGKVGLETEVDVQSVQHMIGRARHTLHKGYVTIYCPSSKKDHLERSLTSLMPVESRLHTTLTDHLLGEIVARTIETKTDAVDYLTWTFLYRRLSRNPNYYGLLGTTVRHISDYLSELVEESITELDENKFVAVDEDNELDVTALNLGMIAAYYALSSDTIAIIANSLNIKSRLKSILEVIACAAEFETLIPLRQAEHMLLSSIAVKAKVDPKLLEDEQLSDTARKVLILLMAYMKRVPLSYELASDVAVILSLITKLLHATVDVLASQGWLKSALSTMELHQLLIQALAEKDSILLQLPHATPDFIDMLTNRMEPIESIFDFLNLEDTDREGVLSAFIPSQVAEIAQFCNAYPSIELSYTLTGTAQEVEVEGDHEATERLYEAPIGGDVKLVAMVSRDNIDESSDLNTLGQVFASRFPHPKREEWWLLVGDANSNTLYGIKRFMLAQRAQVKIDFEVPSDRQIGEKLELKLYLMCDSYLGCDQEYDFGLKLSAAEEVNDDEMEE